MRGCVEQLMEGMGGRGKRKRERGVGGGLTE